MEQRKEFRLGIPRLLNTYTYAPFFNAYFASLGLKSENIVYSDYTTPELYRAGASRGAIDPCYPSKIGIAHVYNLLATKHSKKPLHAIWFPMYDVLHTHLVNLTGSNAYRAHLPRAMVNRAYRTLRTHAGNCLCLVANSGCHCRDRRRAWALAPAFKAIREEVTQALSYE